MRFAWVGARSEPAPAMGMDASRNTCHDAAFGEIVPVCGLNVSRLMQAFLRVTPIDAQRADWRPRTESAHDARP